MPVGPDAQFDEGEMGADYDTVCSIKYISRQIDSSDPMIVSKESSKDKIVSTVMLYTKDGWPIKKHENSTIELFRKLKDQLNNTNGCLFYGSRLVIPQSLQSRILEILHIGHFGMQRMKQLARSAVYWPGIDAQIMEVSRTCSPCAEHQNLPSKVPVHPWMVPEKPWSRVHIDHAINFMGSNWLVLTDAYTKYPCIHQTTSTSTKSTISLLEEDFAHFGYPHTIVSDNATTFTSDEFKQWCKTRGIIHLTGAPYHPATNGAAERLVQTFKKTLKKSSLSPRSALYEFLMQYRRTPLDNGYSPSELLNGRQIRTLIDVLVPSPAHLLQNKQSF